MLNTLTLVAGESSGLIRFIILVVVLGGICYIVSVLPIQAVFKTVIYVVAAIVLFIAALKILLPMAGL